MFRSSHLVALKNAGEERLLEAVLAGRISFSMATEIAQTDSVEMQRKLLKAYEARQMTRLAIRVRIEANRKETA